MANEDFIIENGVLKEYCGAGGDVVIPEGVTEIGASAFDGCTALTSVTIGSGVTDIVGWYFYGCSGLTSITVAEGNKTYRSEGNCLIETATDRLALGCKTSVIPEGVISIRELAFYDCSGLTTITIPDSVTEICASAFDGCIGLTSITYAGTLAEWAAVEKGEDWAAGVPAEVVHCMDGDAPIEKAEE